jgi:hypothetical protein
MKIYISGQITNNPNFKEDFEEVESCLINEGCIVLNPSNLPKGLTQKEYMNICISMVNCCDSIYMMASWQVGKLVKGQKLRKHMQKKLD